MQPHRLMGLSYEVRLWDGFRCHRYHVSQRLIQAFQNWLVVVVGGGGLRRETVWWSHKPTLFLFQKKLWNDTCNAFAITFHPLSLFRKKKLAENKSNLVRSLYHLYAYLLCPSAFECLNQSLWNLVCIPWQLSPSQWHAIKFTSNQTLCVYVYLPIVPRQHLG
jgi:hypothetical protein